jgi:hypothetical protein
MGDIDAVWEQAESAWMKAMKHLTHLTQNMYLTSQVHRKNKVTTGIHLWGKKCMQKTAQFYEVSLQLRV